MGETFTIEPIVIHTGAFAGERARPHTHPFMKHMHVQINKQKYTQADDTNIKTVAVKSMFVCIAYDQY